MDRPLTTGYKSLDPFGSATPGDSFSTFRMRRRFADVQGRQGCEKPKSQVTEDAQELEAGDVDIEEF